MNLKHGCVFLSNHFLLGGYSHRIGRELDLIKVLFSRVWTKQQKARAVRNVCREASVFLAIGFKLGREGGDDIRGVEDSEIIGVDDH